MRKRGIFFTIMALLVVAFLLTYQHLTVGSTTPESADSAAARSRIVTMNDYASTFESYAGQSLASAGYLTLQNLSAQIRAQHKYLDNVNASITFCLNNKTKSTNCVNATQTLNASLDQLTALARTNLSIDTTYAIEQVWVTEERPFEVVFWMNISYTITDPFATWVVTNQTIKAPVDVTGIEDPSFAYNNASGTVRTRTFSQTQFRRTQFDNATFTLFYYNQSYITNPGVNPATSYQFAPSVLQRYAGQLLNGSGCCGIESVLRVQYIDTATINDPRLVNWSFVDYEFFSRTTIPPFDCSKSENIKLQNKAFADRNLRLDAHHFNNIYNLSSYANYSCNP